MCFSFLVDCEIYTNQYSICAPKAFKVFANSKSMKENKKTKQFYQRIAKQQRPDKPAPCIPIFAIN